MEIEFVANNYCQFYSDSQTQLVQLIQWTLLAIDGVAITTSGPIIATLLETDNDNVTSIPPNASEGGVTSRPLDTSEDGITSIPTVVSENGITSTPP